MDEYYIFVTPDNIIWGVGQTKKEAVEDAIESIVSQFLIWDNKHPTVGRVIRASEELALEVYKSGHSDDMWEPYKDGERWLAVLKDHNEVNYYDRLKSIKETKLKSLIKTEV